MVTDNVDSKKKNNSSEMKLDLQKITPDERKSNVHSRVLRSDNLTIVRRRLQNGLNDQTLDLNSTSTLTTYEHKRMNLEASFLILEKRFSYYFNYLVIFN